MAVDAFAPFAVVFLRAAAAGIAVGFLGSVMFCSSVMVFGSDIAILLVGVSARSEARLVDTGPVWTKTSYDTFTSNSSDRSYYISYVAIRLYRHCGIAQAENVNRSPNSHVGFAVRDIPASSAAACAN